MSEIGINVPVAKENEVKLSWSNVNYKVQLRDKTTREIIQNSFGQALPGETLAIMGSSGGGKSTTLDLILGRIKPSTGEFLVNGQPRTRQFKHLASYVQQDDALIPVLSVRETILYSARLQLSSKFSKDTINERVEGLIKSMGLTRCASSKVGNFLIRGISGGERRRVSIASELVTDPKVIVLDEPTSGLDSESSRKVVDILCDLAKTQGKTVICTVHQPSSEVFEKFDRLLLLAQGKTIYFGPTSQALEYFANLGYPCPSFYNPADHYLSILNTDFDDDQAKANAFVDNLAQKFSQSEIGQDLQKHIEASPQDEPGEAPAALGYANSLFHQTTVLTERSYKNAGRNILLYWIRAAMYIAMAILMGTTWWDVGLDQSQINDRFSVHFFAVAFLCFMAVAGIPGIIEEKAVFDREERNGAYSVLAYVISNTLTSMPFIFLITIIFTVIAYPMLKLQGGFDKIFVYVLVLFLSLYTIESIVVVVAALVPVFVVSLALVAFLNGFFMCVQGFFVREQSLPDFWVWGHFWGYQTYSFEALVKSDFEGLEFKCGTQDGGSTFCMFPPTVEGGNTFTGLSVLREYGYQDVNITHWCLVLLGQIIAYRFIFFVVLTLKSRRKA